MVLFSQRDNTPEINAAILRIARLLTVAPIINFRLLPGSNSEKKKQHNKVGAGQPVPDQRKRANKQAEKGQRVIGQRGEIVLDRLFIVENQIQRPDGDTQHNHHVRQRAKLHVHTGLK